MILVLKHNTQDSQSECDIITQGTSGDQTQKSQKYARLQNISCQAELNRSRALFVNRKVISLVSEQEQSLVIILCLKGMCGI